MAIFGYTTVGGTALSGSADYKRACRFQCPENGQAVSLSVYAKKSTSGTGHLRLGIYSDNNGAPDALLGYTDEITIDTTLQWWTANLISPVSLTAGSYYWLAVIADVGYFYYKDTGVTNQFCYNADTYSDGFSNPYGTATYRDYVMSIYCTYTPSGAPTIKTWTALLNTSHVLSRPVRSMKLTQNLNTSHFFSRPFRSFSLTQTLNLTHAFMRHRFMRLTQALQTLHTWTVTYPGFILKQWFATLQMVHVFRRPERKMLYTQALKPSHAFRKPIRVIRISAFLNLIHASRRPHRFIRLLQKSGLIHAYYISKPGVKKTRLFLVVGELAFQLSGD